MNRLDDAEKQLEADGIRNADGPTSGASRENLAIVYEMRGNLQTQTSISPNWSEGCFLGVVRALKASSFVFTP